MFVIGREDDSAAAGVERWCETGSWELGDLLLLRTIGAHHPKIHFTRLNQSLCQKRLVLRDLFVSLDVMGAVGDPLAIGREEWPTVVTERVSKALRLATISILRVDLEITIP